MWKNRLHPMVCLCVWTITLFLLSFLWYGIDIQEEKKEIVPKVEETTKEEEVPFRGNDLKAYIELIRMPQEKAFEKIRVLLVNKKNNSIFYNTEDFDEVKEEIVNEKYRGKILYQQAVDDADSFVIINELPLEEYLYGVIPSEMPSSYPKEALKAQAICARTYAVLHMMNPAYPDYNAHLNDTTSFQVYHSIDEQESTNRAVDETRGMLLFQEDGERLMETFYYSTSCGAKCDASTNTEFAAYIGQINYKDYEVSESWYRWTYFAEELDKAELLKRLQSRKKADIDSVLTMTGKDVFESLPVKELDTVKELFVSKRGEGGVAEELMIHTAKNIYKVRGEYNIRYVLNDPSFAVKKQDGSEVKMKTLLPSAFIALDPVKKDSLVAGYQIRGGGYGHGVGMSQNGAKAMANLGYTAEQILDYYYPESRILENL